MRIRFLTAALFGALLPSLSEAADPLPRKRSNTERLKLERLAATHADVLALQSKRVAVPPRAGFHDYRCILHAHAEDSTHTGGTLPEMLAEAKKANVHCVLLSDHFRPPRDFIDGRWRGMKEGVLFIPGSEVNGFLAYPAKSILNRMELKGDRFVDTVVDGEGLIFLSHVEERKTHPIYGLTGQEITNRHYEAKKDMGSLLALVLGMADPKRLANLQKAVELYPDELFAFQQDYPSLYLDYWDAGTKQKRLTGVAANDCHHNQILLAKMVDESTVRIGTNVDPDDKMQKVSAFVVPGIRELTKGHKSGDVLGRVDTDPYHVSFRNASTHVLATELSEPAIRAALKAGRAYVAHEWMGDAAGFRFDAVDSRGEAVAMMGDEVKSTAGMKLVARLPLPALVRLIRDGKEAARSEGKAEFTHLVQQPGVHRLEAWLKLDDDWRPWIYSNPIYVR